MQDIIFVLLPIAFFAVCAAYIRGLDRLTPGEPDEDTSGSASEAPRTIGAARHAERAS